MSGVKVLFLAANPLKYTALDLAEEARRVGERIRESEYRAEVELVTAWAVRPGDLQTLLLRHTPHVLHFSGHAKEVSLVLQDDRGLPRPVTEAALVGLVRAIRDNLRLVVLNACNSHLLARAVSESGVVDAAIGMNEPITDRAAIEFSAGLYGAIGYGRSIQTAFDLATNALLLEGIAEDHTPQLFPRGGTDPGKVALVSRREA